MRRTVVAETTVDLADGALIRVTELVNLDGSRDRVATVAMVTVDGDELELELDEAAALRLMKALGPVAGVSV